VISVLVVDDDFMVASIHRQYVERVAGFGVVGEAHTGRDALELARAVQPDLVLLDVYLPDMSGLDVLRELRSSTEIDVVAVTAARDTETLQAALRYGVVQYLVKPFTFPALRDKLERYRSWAQALRRTTISGQAEVDRLVGVLRSESAERAVPKGLRAETLDLVEQVVAGTDGEVTAVDVAAAVGVSRVTARRYLEHLYQVGAIAMRPQYGSSGRPVHLYSMTINR
jgi:response regulator of citrate/malate metabolism